MTFKERPFRCCRCEHTFKHLGWDYEPFPRCPACNAEDMCVLNYPTSGSSAGVIGDEIPGGILIDHAICNPDGSSKRYYSKTEIRRAANERGYVLSGDTPKPYNVSWSGRQRRTDGIKADQ